MESCQLKWVGQASGAERGKGGKCGGRGWGGDGLERWAGARGPGLWGQAWALASVLRRRRPCRGVHCRLALSRWGNRAGVAHAGIVEA